MRESVLFMFTIFLLVLMMAVPAVAQQSENGLEQNLQFIEWMGMVFPPHGSLTDYPGYPEGVEFDPADLGLTEVTAEKSWSVLNQDRKTGKVFGDIIRENEKYWIHPKDPRQVPIYKSDCLNRTFAFAGEPSRSQTLAAIAALQDTLDDHVKVSHSHHEQSGRIESGVDEIRQWVTVDRCVAYGECDEGWAWWWPLLLLLIAGGLIYLLWSRNRPDDGAGGSRLRR